MKAIDNGGAIAIKGFNYQKSVVMLIAVLHFLDDDKFELSVETKDDIVVSSKSGATYLQTKSNKLSVTSITMQPKGKASILEKNLSNGEEAESSYKLVAPSFKDIENNLDETLGSVITQGAKVYKYNEAAVGKITERLPKIPQGKLKKARVALTLFGEDQKEALNHIQGVMTSMGIPVDNGHGIRSLDELSRQVDQRSAIVAESEADFLRKKFTKEDLSAIFSHSHKLKHFEKIIEKLGYNTAKQNALNTARVSVAAIHDSNHSAAKKFIEGLEDLINLSEAKVVEETLKAISFNGIDDTTVREAIVIDAYSQVIYEGKYI